MCLDPPDTLTRFRGWYDRARGAQGHEAGYRKEQDEQRNDTAHGKPSEPRRSSFIRVCLF